MNAKTKTVARAGIIAALYVVLSLIVFPVASGAIQFRLSEGLTLLALIFPVIGFFIRGFYLLRGKARVKAERFLTRVCRNRFSPRNHPF